MFSPCFESSDTSLSYIMCRPLVVLQPVQRKPDEEGVYWRMAVFEFTPGKKTKVRREWHLVDLSAELKIKKITLTKMTEKGVTMQ